MLIYTCCKCKNDQFHSKHLNSGFYINKWVCTNCGHSHTYGDLKLTARIKLGRRQAENETVSKASKSNSFDA